MLAPWKKIYDKPRQRIKKQRHHFTYRGLYSQRNGFSNSHVWMWELAHKEGWVIKNWCFRTVVLEKTWESLGGQVNPKGNQSWIIHWKDWCWNWSSNTLATSCKELTHWKRPWCWESWGQEEKGATEDEMVEWHHWLNEHEFEQILGDSEGQGSLACCSPWVPKELDTTYQLNNSNNT